MTLFILILILFIISINGNNNNETNTGSSATTTTTDRPTSMFKAGDDWLSLPEVFSNLDFNADSTPASEEDLEGQIHLRNTRFWGRLYIDGWPQTIQYFRAHFGIEPPLGRKIFVFAEPRDACNDLTNAHLLTSDHVVFVHRGTCTYGTKAKIVSKTNATGIIIINNEPGIDHLPGPDAHDIKFSVSSIAQQEGVLLESIYDEGPSENGFGRKFEGYIVPVNCENSGARCVPATYEERKNIANLIEGGYLNIISSSSNQKSSILPNDLPIEYLLAHFGTKVSHSNISFPMIVAKPAEACTSIENNIKGKVVLVRRGGCPFVKKAEEIQAAGGRALIIGSLNPYILRMGVEPRWKGLNTIIPILMVSKRAYSILVAETYSNSYVQFVEDYHVNSNIWEPLEKLAKGEGWPRSDVYVTKKYEELRELNKQWPDRLITIETAYELKRNHNQENVKSEL